MNKSPFLTFQCILRIRKGIIVLLAILSEYGHEILLTLATAGALGLCKYFHSKLKKYKDELHQKEQAEVDIAIEHKLEPILEEIEELRRYIRETKEIEKTHIGLIISSYRFRLVQLCRLYLRQGYMTQDQFDQLVEFYRLYTALGGNGQAKTMYDQVMKLDVRDPDDV